MSGDLISPIAPVGPRIPVGLAAYGFGYLCGFAGAGTGRACPRPYTAHDLMDLAAARGLGGVEFPLASLPGGLDADTLRRLRAHAEELGLFIVLDGGVVDAAELRELLDAAVALGAPTVRATISHILCGDRRAVRDTWADHLARTARELRAVSGLAEECGVSIGLENHQDVTSEELVALVDAVDSPAVGVTLDTANALAVGEDPLRFARRVLPHVKAAHLKDYYVYKTPPGYRLARCALGDGVVDLPALLALLAREAPAARVSIELGALEARHVRLLEDDYWRGYPPRRVEDVLPALRLREEGARPPGEDWRTPWERGEDGDSLATFERDQFADSVRYLREIADNRHSR